MTTMVCPKCRGAMHSYERNGVTVEQCSDCRGLFLDRGELERLVAAEDTWAGARPSPVAAPTGQGSPPRRYGDDDDDDDDDDRYERGRRRKRKSFISELFA